MRGNSVTGIERTPEKVTPRPGVTIKQGDATQPEMLAPLIAGHDAVMSASRFQNLGCKRLDHWRQAPSCGGGAGSFEVSPGQGSDGHAGLSGILQD